jgi:hypothetical protein
MTVRNAASMGSYGSDWQHRGYSGKGNVVPLLDHYANQPAIVAGGADGVFNEVASASARYPDAVFFAANDVGMYLPKLDHWVSLHSDFLGAWKAVRWLHPSAHEATKYHSIDQRPFVDYVWQQLTPIMALSGYFAMQLAWLMGCSPIILCGVPGSPRRRFFEAAERQDFGYGGSESNSDANVRFQLIQEMERVPLFKANVRSMSGWTRDSFGEA